MDGGSGGAAMGGAGSGGGGMGGASGGATGGLAGRSGGASGVGGSGGVCCTEQGTCMSTSKGITDGRGWGCFGAAFGVDQRQFGDAGCEAIPTPQPTYCCPRAFAPTCN